MVNRLQTGSKVPLLRRGVLGLLCVLWLNMAVLPCAMAFQGDEDCAHCPPEERHENHDDMAAHHEPRHDHGNDHGNDHHEADSPPFCATAGVECCDVMAANVDARGSKSDYKPASDIAITSAPMHSDVGCGQATAGDAAADPPRLAGSSPPLRVLYCVYLK